MNRKQLIEAMAQRSGLSQAQAAKVLGSILVNIGETVKKEKVARVHGLGTFAVKVRAARMSRNPRTGEIVRVPAKNALSFKGTSGLLRFGGTHGTGTDDDT